MEVHPGVRVRLTYMPNDPAPIPAGSTGTVESVTSGSLSQIWVRWDNGRSLAMIPGVDIFEIIGKADPTPPEASSDRIKLPAGVLEGILAVRDSGKTNMLDVAAVERIAGDMGFENAADWLSDPAHKKDYAQGVFKGFEPLGE